MPQSLHSYNKVSQNNRTKDLKYFIYNDCHVLKGYTGRVFNGFQILYKASKMENQFTFLRQSFCTLIFNEANLTPDITWYKQRDIS